MKFQSCCQYQEIPCIWSALLLFRWWDCLQFDKDFKGFNKFSLQLIGFVSCQIIWPWGLPNTLPPIIMKNSLLYNLTNNYTLTTLPFPLNFLPTPYLYNVVNRDMISNLVDNAVVGLPPLIPDPYYNVYRTFFGV